MSKIKNGGLDQYGAEPFEQQQFGTAGVEEVNPSFIHSFSHSPSLFDMLRTESYGLGIPAETSSSCYHATQ